MSQCSLSRRTGAIA